MATKKSTLISDQLRDAVKSAEISRYAISKATGIEQSGLSRFVHGGAGLSLEAIDKLGELLGLELAKGKIVNPKKRST